MSMTSSKEAANKPLNLSASMNKQPIGATWAEDSKVINIDDLFGTKNAKSGPAPSMNQLKSNPSSPTHNSNGMGNQPNIYQPLANNANMNPPNKGFPQMPGMFPPNNPLSPSNNNGNFNSFNNANLFGGASQPFGSQQTPSNQQNFFQAQFKWYKPILWID